MIDTNVLSESWHPIGDPLVKAALAAMTESSLFTSVIVIGELSKGVAKLSAGRRLDELIEWTGYVEKVFGDRVLPIDNAIAWRWGEITMRLSLGGRTLHAPDGLIAATCLVHDLTLLTRNVDDFQYTGVHILNPWTTPIA